jgi:hypothetical protein
LYARVYLEERNAPSDFLKEASRTISDLLVGAAHFLRIEFASAEFLLYGVEAW